MNGEAAGIELRSEAGYRVGTLWISALPSGGPKPIDAGPAAALPGNAPPVAVVEAGTYRYSLDVAHAQIIGIEPAEMFDADDRSLATGRLRPQQFVGEVAVQVQFGTSADAATAIGRFDVRPAKFEDEEAFRSMLSDLADRAVEVLHQGFSASAGRFAARGADSPRLLYQQFAVIHSRLFSPELEWALRRIGSEPYETWIAEVETRLPGTPVKGTSRLARSIVKPGTRRPVHRQGGLPSIPARIEVDHPQRTVDNVPNRFVRFVLQRWREIAVETGESIERAPLTSHQVSRGRREVERTVERLDEVLESPAFRSVGHLHSYPAGNQVLLKRDGYRQLTAAAAVVDASIGIDLGVEDPFVVSRRNVATLYEYWCFVRLAHAVDQLFGGQGLTQLFEESAGGMSLRLKRSEVAQATFAARFADDLVDVALFYNKTFAHGKHGGQSWTTVLRPDASVRISVRRGGSPVEHWLHFDAKYRVVAERADGRLVDVDLAETLEVEASTEPRPAGLRRERTADVAKMHAYRDGIRGSAAAYVLYPGDRARTFRFADETLPSIGVVPLRPHLIDADDNQLRGLLSNVLSHALNESTRHERALFWERRSYAGPSAPFSTTPPPEVADPPADVKVLLGFVKNSRHRRWVEDRGLYNVRSGPRRGALTSESGELDAEFLVLYGDEDWQGPPVLVRRKSPWAAVDRAEMERLGYPSPRGTAYLCCSWVPVEFQPVWLRTAVHGIIDAPGMMRGAPVATTWIDLAVAGRPTEPE